MADDLKESDFVFPEKLIDADSYSARYYSELLRGLTHKLNNLLAVIQGFSSLILLQEDLDEVAKENLQHMKEAGVSASLLGERVLPAAGGSRVELGEVKLAEVASMLKNRYCKQAEEAQVPFRYEIASGLPVVRTDASRLRDVLDHLVRNAIEAAGKEGEVSIEIRPSSKLNGRPDHVAIVVRNTGSEIPPDKLTEIFKPFYTTKDSSHWGIGLTTAYVVAGQMGVDLGVRSGQKATAFLLRVPVAT